MNKLVSRNPVQRFKEGKKLLFAQNGAYVPVIIGNSTFQYNPYNKTYKGNQSLGQNLQYKDIVNAFNQQYENLGEGNNALYRKKGSRTTWMNSKGRYVDKSKKPIVNTVPQQNTNNKQSVPTAKSVQTTSSNKYTGSSVRGNAYQKNNNIINQDFSYLKDQIDTHYYTPKKSLLDNIFIKGYQTNNDITQAGGVRAMQQKLKDAGYDLGRFGIDGKWGRDTQKAYDDWKLKQQVTFKTPSIEENTGPVLSTPTIPQSEYTFTESQLQGLGENPYYEPHPELRQFNRTQVRDFLRKNSINPYSMTGAQRKALRMIMNGQSTEQDKNLIGLTGGLTELLTKYNYLKKGGNLLPSRNIVQRFKQKKFK